MARPRKFFEKKTVQNFSIHPSLLKAMQLRAEESGESLSQVLEHGMNAYLGLSEMDLNNDLREWASSQQQQQQDNTAPVTEDQLDAEWANLVEMNREVHETKKRLIAEGVDGVIQIKKYPRKRPADWDFNNPMDHLRYSK